MSRRFDFRDDRPENDYTRPFVECHVGQILRGCIEIPSPYWPYLVNTSCQLLLDRGLDEALVRRIYRRTVRELRLGD
jgi:hypothetical protein